MSTNRALATLAVAMMGLPVILGAALCYLRPDRLWEWGICTLFLPAAWALKARFKHAAARIRISYAMIVSSLVISVPLGNSLAAALGLSGGPAGQAIGDRLTNVLAGLCIMFLGNQLPKMLPSSDGSCDTATIQNIRRRTGWAHVLAGLAFAVLWLVLPVQLARPIGIAVIVAGVLVPWAVTRFCYMGLASRPSFP